MGKALVAQLLPVLEKMKWAGVEEATPNGAIVFKTAIDQVDSFRGDPKVLATALRTLRTADSLPYAFAGVAYVLLAASAEEDGSYDGDGLDAALHWLERAQDLSPELMDLNVVEPLIYIFGGRLDDARLVLDYLHEQDPYNYYLHRAEMYYWQQAGDLEQAMKWNQQAMEQAETVPQRLRLKSVAARLYLQAGDSDRALQTYKEALHFDPDNAWLCHQISLLHLQREEMAEATQYNERALKIQPDFTPARELREQLSGDERSSGFLGRIFG
jgi:tetratricopeptide (TPR) repeat protein